MSYLIQGRAATSRERSSAVRNPSDRGPITDTAPGWYRYISKAKTRPYTTAPLVYQCTTVLRCTALQLERVERSRREYSRCHTKKVQGVSMWHCSLQPSYRSSRPKKRKRDDFENLFFVWRTRDTPGQRNKYIRTDTVAEFIRKETSKILLLIKLRLPAQNHTATFTQHVMDESCAYFVFSLRIEKRSASQALLSVFRHDERVGACTVAWDDDSSIKKFLAEVQGIHWSSCTRAQTFHSCCSRLIEMSESEPEYRGSFQRTG